MRIANFRGNKSHKTQDLSFWSEKKPLLVCISRFLLLYLPHETHTLCRMKPTLKDLRTTYRVLTHLDEAVPQQLIISLADRIKAEEKSRQYRKIARMSEEDLIRYQATPKRRLRINLPCGRIVQEKTNEATFYAALREIDFQQILQLDLKQKGKPLFVGFAQPRKVLVGHKQLHESCFVRRGIKADERLRLLQRLDEALQLNWEILLI